MLDAMRVVITAGPTREHLDPVRFLSNPSTGKMGFAAAAEAARRGHEVVLVAGPVALKTPNGVRRVDVVSAREMLAEVERAIWNEESGTGKGGRDAAVVSSSPVVLVSTAAVADWRPEKCAAKKLKKGVMSGVLKLVRNPDILKTVAGKRNRKTVDLRLVGFAAETNDVLKEAARKCREKGLEFIVANDVTQKGCGFGTDTNRVTFVFPDGRMKCLPLMSKRMVAKKMLEEIEGKR